VLIPAWHPQPILTSLVMHLAAQGFGAIILVDDGSGNHCAPLFDQLAALPRTHVLRHADNPGKGRALKTGFNYCLNALPHMKGAVTADADGQHEPRDILRVALAMQTSNGRVVLGSRDFAHAMPWRSRCGNTLTRSIFGWVTGTRLHDTHTGLRGFPRALLPELLVLKGERYEYETTALGHLCRNGNTPLEVPIETVYLRGKKSSHFRPVLDSVRIYLVLVHLFASSLRHGGRL
jgi:glycosyltransferase involved in cell wall biosynthesis